MCFFCFIFSGANLNKTLKPPRAFFFFGGGLAIAGLSFSGIGADRWRVARVLFSPGKMRLARPGKVCVDPETLRGSFDQALFTRAFPLGLNRLRKNARRREAGVLEHFRNPCRPFESMAGCLFLEEKDTEGPSFGLHQFRRCYNPCKKACKRTLGL